MIRVILEGSYIAIGFDENGNDGDDHDKAGGLLMVIIVIQEEAGW